MKRYFAVLLLVLGVCAAAQNVNPQTNFAATVTGASPSLYLNYNDLTASFKDQVSGDVFGGSAASYGSSAAGNAAGFTLTATAGNGGVFLANKMPFTQSGALASVSLGFYAAPPAGQIVTVLIATCSGASCTVNDSFTVTASAAPGWQTFTAGTNFAARNVTSGECLGWYVTSGTSPGLNGSTSSFVAYTAAAVPSGAEGYTSYVAELAINAVVTTTTAYTSGTVAVRQPGFDSTTPDNTSAGFPYNGWNAAPNVTLGAIDWSVPWSMMVQVDRLNWNRTGTLVLASKGDSSVATNPFWELYLQMNGNQSQICFVANGPNGAGAPFSVAKMQTCTGSIDAMPNGYNYNLVVTNNGSGYTSAFDIYVNGLDKAYIPETQSSDSYQYGFGTVGIALSGSGTGYAATTAITNNGTGGANCVVSATMDATSGVPSSITYTQSSGCTSVPTLSLVSATGTGAVLTPTLYGTSMNSTVYPLMAPGYVSAGAYYGVAGTAATQTPTYVDEFAMFPGMLTETQIESLYAQTKFYQGLLKSMPAVPYMVVFDNDGCQDTDNLYALAVAIAAQKIGYFQLAGVVDTVGDGLSQAMYRQMLDQAGLANVPVSVPSQFGISSVGLCSAANLNTFDATTPQSTGAYEQAKTMYRQIFANNPTTPVFILLGGSFRGVADWMQSPADSISPLTGAQMVARNAANGGAIYAQGLAANTTFTADNSLEDWTAGQYVVENNGALPIYWYGGEPQNTGPGVLWTRTSKDPMFLMANALGLDTRPGYDSLMPQAMISNLFAGGVNVAIGGSGTGYATQTAFTSTGGGASCTVSGIMVSVGGVPSSIMSTGGVAASTLGYEGIGSGCFTAATPPAIVLTAPTGTGAVLTATTTASPCGTVSITAANAGSTTTATCSQHYFLPMSLNAVSGATPVMEWFLNSLIDPVPGGVLRGR